MKLNSQTLVTLLIVLAFTVSMATPVFANSRSATVRVTCTILPILEISTPQVSNQNFISRFPAAKEIDKNELALKTTGSLVSVGTNLGQNYHLSEVLLKRLEGPVKLYSVTAL